MSEIFLAHLLWLRVHECSVDKNMIMRESYTEFIGTY